MVYEGCQENLGQLADLAAKLWDSHPPQDFYDEFAGLMDTGGAMLFLSCDGIVPIGFAQCQLRHDYVEGTNSSPVGYLEGIYVLPEYRRKGYARELLRECERWAEAKGCTEFASDCELSNKKSLEFHLHAGFTEANRIICFTKKL